MSEPFFFCILLQRKESGSNDLKDDAMRGEMKMRSGSELGKKIRLLRKKNDMSQREFAGVLSVTPQTISKWENGKSNPDIDSLVDIAKYFEITMDELFEFENEA